MEFFRILFLVQCDGSFNEIYNFQYRYYYTTIVIYITYDRMNWKIKIEHFPTRSLIVSLYHILMQ